MEVNNRPACWLMLLLLELQIFIISYHNVHHRPKKQSTDDDESIDLVTHYEKKLFML